jgi:hypothetical protein
LLRVAAVGGESASEGQSKTEQLQFGRHRE